MEADFIDSGLEQIFHKYSLINNRSVCRYTCLNSRSPLYSQLESLYTIRKLLVNRNNL